MQILGVICARSGSKGLANKNLYRINGKPMIWYAIKSALDSKLIKCVVSTDSQEIAETSGRYGAEVILRPSIYAQDDSRIELALHHALIECENHDERYDAVMLLQCSSPLRTTTDINNCITHFEFLGFDNIVSVAEIPDHPYKIKIIANHKLDSWMPEMDCQFYRRQDLPKMYIDNGAIYLIKRDLFLQTKRVIAGNSGAYIMPRQRSIDVHDVYDAIMVEALIKKGILND